MVMTNMTRTNRTLVIMAKAPRLGSVKTRLTKTLPVQAVTELYQCFLNDTIALAKTIDHVETAIMCPEPDVEDLSRALANPARVVPQTGKGLAAALDCVFARFAGNGSARVVAFNSDSPHLPASVLQAAFDVLETCDLVVGPTHDGGYYLVGAKASYPGLFGHDSMGTTNALDALFERASRLHLTLCLVEPFYDIDIGEDLRRLAKELQRVPGKAPRTAKWLANWASAAPPLEQANPAL
jgi:rSAM/selenodomain-associated transferase 1